MIKKPPIPQLHTPCVGYACLYQTFLNANHMQVAQTRTEAKLWPEGDACCEFTEYCRKARR